MTFDSIPIRFTENKYASKKEVSDELKTPLIDPFWEKILAYRKQFNRAMPLFSLDKRVYSYCLCNFVSTKINSCEMKLINLLGSYKNLNDKTTNDLQLFNNSCYVDCLNSVADGVNYIVDDNYLSMLVNKKISDYSEQFAKLNSYYSTLELALKYYNKPVDEDLIAALYSCLIMDNELTSLYRNMDTNNYASMGMMYSVVSISKLMSDLYNFINDFDAQPIVKASTVFYYVNYLKPFEVENEKMALILTKLVLAKGNLGQLGFLLNIEPLMYQLDDDKLSNTMKNVDKNFDVTYFLIYFAEVINNCIDNLSSKISNLQALQLKNEYYASGYEETNISKEDIQYENEEVNQLSKQLADLEEVKEEKVIEVKKPEVKEEVKVVVVEKEVVKPIQSNPTVSVDSGLAINILPPQLSEKELERLEEDLLESDPELKRGQAYFYVRHCTLGKRYTINQFKKEVGCAYETARTSMDALAKLGYYRQEFVKNKKVYTPIKRK